MAVTILTDGNDLASSNGDNGLAMTAMMIMMAMMEWFGNAGKGSDLVPIIQQLWSLLTFQKPGAGQNIHLRLSPICSTPVLCKLPVVGGIARDRFRFDGTFPTNPPMVIWILKNYVKLVFFEDW